MRESTDVFKLYQDGIDYNTRTNFYSKVDLHWDFYNAKQWRGIKSEGLPKVQVNICRQSVDYKVASIMSQNIAISYDAENVTEYEGDEEYQKQENQRMFASMITDVVKLKWEKLKMNKKIRQALMDGAIAGDMCLYSYWDATKETGQLEKGDVETMVIDSTNVFFADANTPDVSRQEWIIISGRDSVLNLKAEAKKNKISQDDIDAITGDDDTEYQAGSSGKIEMDGGDGKCTYLIKFWKDGGTVKWCKKTKFATIVKEQDLGIKDYPINFVNWSIVKGSMHGMSDIEGIIDNQISINQMHAMIVTWMRRNAFGKTVYDSTRLTSWSNSVTAAIPVQGDVSGVVQQLQGGNFNQAIATYTQMLTSATKDVNGVNDAALGQVNPTNTSAIIATVKQASIPLENVQANVYQLVEDWALTIAQLIVAKYNKRNVQRRAKINGQDVVVMTQYEKPSENLLLNVRIDVGPSSYFSEVAGQQTLDNLYMNGKIDDIQYFERMKKFNVIPDVEGIIEDKKMLLEQAQAQQQQAQEAMPQMSPEMQAQFNSLPQEQQDALLQQFLATQA